MKTILRLAEFLSALAVLSLGWLCYRSGGKGFVLETTFAGIVLASLAVFEKYAPGKQQANVVAEPKSAEANDKGPRREVRSDGSVVTVETRDSIFLGEETYHIHYGYPNGARALRTANKEMLRTRLSFVSQVFNPMDAMFGADAFALNPLQMYFSDTARNILECRSERFVRRNRSNLAAEIKRACEVKFSSLGVRLVEVRIGDLERIG